MAAGRRAIRIIGWVVLALILLALVAGGGLWLGGTPLVAWAIEHPVSAALGRQISIDGPLRIAWGSPTRIVAQDVHVANAPWSRDPEMFAANRFEVDVFLRSLVFGPTRFPLVMLDGAKLLLEKSKQGQKNWQFGLSSAAPKKRGQFPYLRRLEILDSTFVYRNDVTDAVTDLGVSELNLTEDNSASPLRIDAAGTFQKAPIHLAGSVGSLTELRDTSKPYPVDLQGRLDQIRLVAQGTIQKPLDFSGINLRLSLAGAKLGDLAQMLGVPLPKLPNFRGTAVLAGGNGRFALNAMSVKVGASDLEGGIDIDTDTKVPSLKAQLTSSYIDLADFAGLYGGKPAHSSAPPPPPAKDGRVLPNTPISVHMLPEVDADLSFYGTRIKSVGGVPIERIALRLLLEKGELTLKPLRFHLANGDVDLDFHFTPFTRTTPPKMDAAIDVRHVDLHKLLDQPSRSAMLRETAGTVGGFVKIDTTGVSTRQFLANMNGDAGFFMENGRMSQLLERLAPIDVLSALGVYLAGDQPVPIRCLVSRFAIKEGVATATTLTFDTDSDTIDGKGNVNFADETLFLDLTPYNKHATAISLRTPVELRGTFAKPTFHLETGRLIARLGAAIGLGIVAPPAALLPLIDTGLGEKNICGKAYAAQQPPGNPAPKSGSSTPP